MSSVKTMQKCEQNLFCGVNTAGDLDNMTDLEKKHFPVITAPETVEKNQCFEVVIEVGKFMPHPNEVGHFIEFIELYAGERYLARMDFTPVTTCPTVKTCLALDHIHGKLRAFTRCNLHGTWEGDFDLEIRD